MTEWWNENKEHELKILRATQSNAKSGKKKNHYLTKQQFSEVNSNELANLWLPPPHPHKFTETVHCYNITSAHMRDDFSGATLITLIANLVS